MFLVRKQSSNLVLSKSIRGWISHDLIQHGPSGYHLEGRRDFRSVSNLVRYYQQHPLNEKDGQVLGEAADKKLHAGNGDELESAILSIMHKLHLLLLYLSELQQKSKNSEDIFKEVMLTIDNTHCTAFD